VSKNSVEEYAMPGRSGVRPVVRNTASDVVPLKNVDREIGRRLRAIEGLGKGPVLRACMSNLVVFCDTPELATRITSELPGVVATHPARVLLLCVDPAATDGITASVSVQGRLSGEGHWVVSEQVQLRCPAQATERLPYSIRPILIGDLPTNLWWAAAAPPPLAGSLLFDLADPAQQVIYDSIGWREPARGVVATASWLAQDERGRRGTRYRVTSDLNWRRLKYWRRLLAQALDPVIAPGAIESITELQIDHGPHAVVQAWELASWLASRLEWQVQGARVQPNVEIDWRARAPHGNLTIRLRRLPEGPTEVRQVRIACTQDGKPVTLNLAYQDERRLAVTPEGLDVAPRTIAVQPQPLPDLMARQLSDREHDPVFFESMSVARVFAESVLGG
jgi:glucose-6-phosphate dehydrogenase assembly protein OpcA